MSTQPETFEQIRDRLAERMRDPRVNHRAVAYACAAITEIIEQRQAESAVREILNPITAQLCSPIRGIP